MNTLDHQRAIKQLRAYAADDPCEAERLAPFFAAWDSGDASAIAKAGKATLDTYCACSTQIDALYTACVDHA